MYESNVPVVSHLDCTEIRLCHNSCNLTTSKLGELLAGRALYILPAYIENKHYYDMDSNVHSDKSSVPSLHVGSNEFKS